MSESPKPLNDSQIPILPALSLSQLEHARNNTRLIERRSSPRPPMGVAAILSITAPFQSDTQPETSDDLSSYQLECPFLSLRPDDGLGSMANTPDDTITNPVWLTPPHVMLFYAKGSVTPPSIDTIKRHVLDSLRSHDAVFIISVRKNVGVPVSWIAALETLKSKFSKDAGFDFMFIPSDTDETFGGLYVDGQCLTIPLDHDDYMCTTDDALITRLETRIAGIISPLYKRCRAVRKEVERVATTAIPVADFIAPEPLQPPISETLPVKKPAHRGDASDLFLARWEAEARAERDAANKVLQAIIRSSSRP